MGLTGFNRARREAEAKAAAAVEKVDAAVDEVDGETANDGGEPEAAAVEKVDAAALTEAPARPARTRKK